MSESHDQYCSGTINSKKNTYKHGEMQPWMDCLSNRQSFRVKNPLTQLKCFSSERTFLLFLASRVSVTSDVLIKHLCIPDLTSEADGEIHISCLCVTFKPPLHSSFWKLSCLCARVPACMRVKSWLLSYPYVGEKGTAWGMRKEAVWVKKCSLSAQLSVPSSICLS